MSDTQAIPNTAHDCGTSRKGFGASFWRCPTCSKLWRVTTDNVAWAGWVEARGLWKLIAKFATRGTTK